MCSDKTAGDRVRRQRKYRLAESWCEVKVWVPTKRDAEDIRNLAAERRAKAEALEGLNSKVKRMNEDTVKRIAQAIAENSSAAYNTPSGTVLTLLSELADEGDLLDFSQAFIIFARAKPANAIFVENRIPAIILNYWVKRCNIEISALIQWQSQDSGWAEILKQEIRDPVRFKTAVEAFVEDIKSNN